MPDEPAAKILTIEKIDDGLRVVGQVDLSNIDDLREAIDTATQGADALRLELSGCSYMGSEGISTLIEASTALGERPLVLEAPGDFLQKIFDLTGIARLPNVRIEAPG